MALLGLSACDAVAGPDAASDEVDAVQVVVGRPGVLAIVDELNEYWAVEAEQLDFTWEPVTHDRVVTGGAAPVCDGEPVPDEDVEGNAFVDAECAEGILVAYDPAYVGTSLARAESTLAHEWGHVVQAQATELDLSLDPEGLPIDAELQADCFAGAWAGDTRDDLTELRREVVESGDEDGVGIDDPEAHGTPEERREAFDLGVEGGPLACIETLPSTLP